MLTDTDIRKILCDKLEWKGDNTLRIYPFLEDCLTPVGYDLRVGGSFASRRKGLKPLKPGKKIAIKPGETVLIRTYEKIGMPRNESLSGFVFSKVSIVSEGLSHVATTVDADWEGELLICVNNPTKKRILLNHRKPFCTLVFFENTDKPTKNSDYPPDRVEGLMEEFGSKDKLIIRVIKLLINLLPVFILLSIGYLGYKCCENYDQFVGIVTLAVGLSWLINNLIKRINS